MWKEFKEFAFKGNVVDLVVGIVIGAAFGAIVTSLVNSFINPLVGLIVGKTNLANLFVSIPGGYHTAAGAQAAGAIVFSYGAFLNALINFALIALVLFIVVKAVNRFRKVEAPTTKACPFCTTDIPVAATRCPACTSDLNPPATDGSPM